MRNASRIGGALAALVLGLTGAVALATPAQATFDQPVPTEVSFVDDCDGTTITLSTGTFYEEYEVTITADGVPVVSEDGSLTWDGEVLDPNSVHEIFVPALAGEINVDFTGSPGGWPKTHSWKLPENCTVTVEQTQPECYDGTDVSLEQVVTATNDGGFESSVQATFNAEAPVDVVAGDSASFAHAGDVDVVVTLHGVTIHESTQMYTTPPGCPGTPGEPGEPGTPGEDGEDGEDGAAAPTPAPGSGGGLAVTPSPAIKAAVVGASSVLLGIAALGLSYIRRRVFLS